MIEALLPDLSPVGSTTPNPLPGDLILCHGTLLIHRLVQLGQRTRMLLARTDTRADRRDWTHYDHVAVFVGSRAVPGWPNGTPCVIEALPGREGVRLTPLAAFIDREYTHVPVHLSDDDQLQAVAYLDACLPLSYGLLHYIGMVITTLSGGTITLSGSQSEICSSMAAQALVRGSYIWDRPPASMMPADLARAFDVRPVPPDDQPPTP